MAKARKFSGSLSQPLPAYMRQQPSGLLDPIKERQLAEIDERLQALFDHYNIKRDAQSCWRALACLLARDFVPGFQFVRKRGRKPVDSIEEQLAAWQLAMRVDARHRHNRRLSDQATLKRLVEFKNGELLPKFLRGRRPHQRQTGSRTRGKLSLRRLAYYLKIGREKGPPMSSDPVDPSTTVPNLGFGTAGFGRAGASAQGGGHGLLSPHEAADRAVNSSRNNGKESL